MAQKNSGNFVIYMCLSVLNWIELLQKEEKKN